MLFSKKVPIKHVVIQVIFNVTKIIFYVTYYARFLHLQKQRRSQHVFMVNKTLSKKYKTPFLVLKTDFFLCFLCQFATSLTRRLFFKKKSIVDIIKSHICLIVICPCSSEAILLTTIEAKICGIITSQIAKAPTMPTRGASKAKTMFLKQLEQFKANCFLTTSSINAFFC